MPLDGHSYLVGQGWSGKGAGLRQGAITRPLAIPQKKTLSGLGKDRDEAFPFWDHLYTLAAKTIQVKLHKDDSSDSGSSTTPTLPALTRTSTGILSNKRPITGTSASTSGSATPDLEPSSSSTITSRMSLMAAARRDAAKRGLYSRFFRGPVLGPDYGTTKDARDLATLLEAVNDNLSENVVNGISVDEKKREEKKQKEERKEKKERKRRKCPECDEARKAETKEKKKRKSKEEDNDSAAIAGTRRERKRKHLLGDEDDGTTTKAPKKKRKREASHENGTDDDPATEVSRKREEKHRKRKGRGPSNAEIEDARHDAVIQLDAKEEKKRRKEERGEGRKREPRSEDGKKRKLCACDF